MKLIGYWMQDLKESELPLPQELAGELPSNTREVICKYLAQGTVFETYRGYSWCRFHCGVDSSEMGSREYCDGEWIWPEGLAHYVNAHGILLPEEFIACATSTRQPRSDSDRSESLEFWISWAKSRRSRSIRMRLNQALADARAAELTLINELVEQIRQKETESSVRCLFAGCTARALTGRKFCARHLLNDAEIAWRTAHLFSLPRQI